MEWPLNTGPLGPELYPNATPSLYSLESNSEQVQHYPPPTNPPWESKCHFGATDAPTFPDEHGSVLHYPPPPNALNPALSVNYPPELIPSQEYPPIAFVESSSDLYQEYPPKASLLGSSPDSWKDVHSNTSSSNLNLVPNWELMQNNAGSGIPYAGTIPSLLQYESYSYVDSTNSYPSTSAFDSSSNYLSSQRREHSLPNLSAPAPHAYHPSTSSSISPPPSYGPPGYPPTPISVPEWLNPAVSSTYVEGHTSFAPNLPGGPGPSFAYQPHSTHPLLQSDDEDFVPYGGDGNDDDDDDSHGEEELNTGYVEEVDYSHTTLEKYGMNLTTSAKDGTLSPVIGRDDVVRQCIEILTRKSKCNPVLVGHPGVGKTAVVEGLAQRIVKGDVPEPLRKCKVISVDMSNIIGDTKYRGQFEEKMKEVLDQATEAKRKVILFFDELHRLIGTGSTEGNDQDASQIMKPVLARGDFLCIGATTYDEYTKFIEKDQALSRRFQKVVVNPPTAEDTISILRGLKPRFESHHGISIVDDALKEAVDLSERFIPDRFLPDKAIDLVDEAASKVKIELISKPSKLVEIDRAILQLDMERLSVTATTGQPLQNRLHQILSDLEGLKLRQKNLSRKWNKEKAITTQIMSLKEKITTTKTDGSNTSSSVSGLISDRDDSYHYKQLHKGIICDICGMFPIVGPRFKHATENSDICGNCYHGLRGGSVLTQFQASQFVGAEPPRLTCDGCYINPIRGNYYVESQYKVLCQSCWRKEMSSHHPYSQSYYTEFQNGLKDLQTEKQGNESGTNNLKELEVQLKTAELEWKEYQKNYKPLIHLEVTSMSIAEVLSKKTGIPVTKMGASQSQQLLQLDVELHKRVIGQDEACNAIARAIQRSRAGLSDPKRPIASLMFMGPTGVGKTELAKALASHLFNSEDSIVRVDMSEYGDKNSISRLTGAAPGLQGYGEGGQLTTPVRRQPYSVVLFDEIEKAHKDIFNIFLQMLDDGRLTDSAGRLVNFTNTVIIMTSNVGADKIMEVASDSHAYNSNEEAYQVMKSMVMEAAREKYRPEFINRIDEFIVFRPLTLQQICEVVKLQLDRVNKRLQDRVINLRVSESALQLLSTMGYDPRYGARPVKRVIQQRIEDPIAQGILRGHYVEGCTIMVDTEVTNLHQSHQPQQKLTYSKLT